MRVIYRVYDYGSETFHTREFMSSMAEVLECISQMMRDDVDFSNMVVEACLKDANGHVTYLSSTPVEMLYFITEHEL